MTNLLNIIGQGLYGIPSFLNYFGSSFSKFFDTVKTGATDAVNIGKYILQAKGLADEFISTLPDWLRPYALLTVAVCIAFVVVGRVGGAKRG